MARPVIEYQILVASPGDVPEARKTTLEAVATWNALNSSSRNARLSAVMWESHSTPEMGDRAQAIINRQMVDDCDLAIGIFWTRLGTPTGDSPSGTVEELERLHAAGKRTAIYYCTAAVDPYKHDPEEFSRVKAYRAQCEAHGLLSTFATTDEFRDQLLKLFTRFVDDADRSTGGDAATPTPIAQQASSSLATVSASSQVFADDTEKLSKKPSWISLLKSGKYFEGMNALRDAVNNGQIRAPLHEMESFAQLIAYEDGGVYQAFVDLERSAMKDRKDTECWLWYGLALRHAHRDAEAMEAMKHVLANTTNGSTRRMCVNILAAHHFATGEESIALDLWRTELAAEKDPRGISEYLVRIAEVYEREAASKDLVLATSFRELALENQPTDSEARLALAWRYVNELGAPSLSFLHYLEVRTRDREDGLAAINAGWVAEKLSLPITAVDHYRAAQRLDQALAVTNMGWNLLDAGFSEQAEQLVAEARRINPGDEHADRLAVAIRDRRKEEATRWASMREQAEQVRALRTKYARAIASHLPSIDLIIGTYSGTLTSFVLDTAGAGRVSGSFQYSRSSPHYVFTGELQGAALRLNWQRVPAEPAASSLLTALQVPSRQSSGQARLVVSGGLISGFSFKGSETVDPAGLDEFALWELRKVQ